MANSTASGDYVLPRELLQRYAKPGPRYTSYPTAPVWSDSFDAAEARRLYAQNNPADSQAPLALYAHIPFCTSLCWYCGCHVKIERDKAKVTGPYLKALKQELALLRAELAPGRQISQMHWGGGTPTYLSPEDISDLTASIVAAIPRAAGAEFSIEVDPRVTTDEHLQALRESGFNRLSMGVQDFNPEVQAAVHRLQPFEKTAELIHNARKRGFESINIDLMYGLPHQSIESFAATLEQVRELDPDRIALFHYAHVPWLKPAQKLIKSEDLPDTESKTQIFELAIATFLERGYRYIGMDHFAKPDDELTLAQQAGSLRRNFMGYTTQAGVDLYGLGVSSISEIDGHFVQNQREIATYQQQLAAGQLPTLRGMWLSPDDLLRKAVIEELICNGVLDFAAISQRFAIDFERYFAAELQACAPLAEDGLIALNAGQIRVQPRGQILIRNVCMIWDAYLQAQQGKQMFSQTL